MITSDVPVFPSNIVEIVAHRMGLIDPDIFVARRPLRETDPNQSIGVFAAVWTPDLNSYEMRGRQDPGAGEPTLGRYVLTIQAFIKDMDEERGMATHSVLSTVIRAILARDEPLRVGLASLGTETLGVVEKVSRWGVTAQRFHNNELQSEWLFLSSVELWVDTETR